MPRFPAFAPKQVIRKLKRLGFVEKRQKGSHKIFRHVTTNARAVVPFHQQTVPKGTMMRLLDEAGISREEFLRA